MSLYDKEEMLESSIVEEIVRNKDKIRFIREYKQGYSFKNYEFRLYLNKRNLFGFRKYITIITDDPTRYFFVSIEIIIPAFISDIGYDDKLEIQDTENNKRLHEILHECYKDKNRYVILNKLYKILENNLKKGK